MAPTTRLLNVLLLTSLVTTAGCGGGSDTPATTGSTKPATSPPAGTKGSATRGEQVFAVQGCGSCHAFAAAGSGGTIGPDLDKTMAADAGKVGKPLEAFVREAITDPNAFVAKGYKRSVMPADYRRRIRAAALDDLVAFLVAKR